MTTVTRRYQGEEYAALSGTPLKSFWYGTKVLGASNEHVIRSAEIVGNGDNSNSDGYVDVHTLTNYFDASVAAETDMSILRTVVDRHIVNQKSTVRSRFMSIVFSFQHQTDCVTQHEVFSDDVVSIKLRLGNTTGSLNLFGSMFDIENYTDLLLSASSTSATSRLLRFSLFSTLLEYPVVGSYAACTFDSELGVVGYQPSFIASMQRSIHVAKRWQYETNIESRS